MNKIQCKKVINMMDKLQKIKQGANKQSIPESKLLEKIKLELDELEKIGSDIIELEKIELKISELKITELEKTKQEVDKLEQNKSKKIDKKHN